MRYPIPNERASSSRHSPLAWAERLGDLFVGLAHHGSASGDGRWAGSLNRQTREYHH